MSTSSPLETTYRGYVNSTMDALILFESCLNGTLVHTPRRPHDREREQLIQSGAIFVYEEHSSGIKRWTDGFNWSPSRILNNFLIYRELEGPFPPGEKKRARKPKKNPTSKTADSARDAAVLGAALANGGAGLTESEQRRVEMERNLVGSLVDSYPFKPDGLVKKTISINWKGIPHHLVSYYTIDDVLEGRLMSPSQDPNIMHTRVRPGLITGQNFRNPITDGEPGAISHMAAVDVNYQAHGMHGFHMDHDVHRSMAGHVVHPAPLYVQHPSHQPHHHLHQPLHQPHHQHHPTPHDDQHDLINRGYPAHNFPQFLTGEMSMAPPQQHQFPNAQIPLIVHGAAPNFVQYDGEAAGADGLRSSMGNSVAPHTHTTHTMDYPVRRHSQPAPAPTPTFSGHTMGQDGNVWFSWSAE